MVTFQKDSIGACWEEFVVLAREHHQGTQHYRRHEPFAPSRERYAGYEDLGMYHFMTARDQGRMVGYFGCYDTRSMHSQRPIVQEDILYLTPAYRRGRTALRFIQFCEAVMASAHPEGFEILVSCEQDNTSGIHRLLGHLAYLPVITVYSKTVPPGAAGASPSHQEALHHVGST